MGDVYHARDIRLNRDVAVKFVSDKYLGDTFGSGTPSPATDQGTPATPGTLSRRRFLREAQSASALSHPNICTIYDIGEQDGRPFLVMELLRGQTLKDAMQPGALSPAETIEFSRQAASALAAAHALGIVHRDIKPANIFVVGQPGKRQVKILDFGLAKRHGIGNLQDSGEATAAFSGEATAPGNNVELTSPGSTMGTAAYMSPEQARGLNLDTRTDLFSLGSVVYEMATGRKAFDGDSAADVFAALLTSEPPPPSTINPAMPRALDPIVAKLHAKDKEQRYPTADDLLRDLEALDWREAQATAPVTPVSGPVLSVPVEAATASHPAAAETAHQSAVNIPPAQPARKPRNTAGIALAIVLGLIFVAGLAWWKHSSGSASSPSAAAVGPDGQRAVGAAPALVKDSIILATFINHTGDPVFDTTLNEALRIDLEQSPVINIVSEDHLRQSVKYLGKPEDTPITPEIAREIGEREGMKAILTGTIANIGNQYVIMLSAQNTATGDEIASEQATAATKEHVLDALSTTAAGMRARLGEDLASIKKLNTPFGQATTTSLEAFRAYALGDVAHDKAMDIPDAEGHYLRAIELDPDFAMAYARLGVVYNNSGQVGKAKQYFAKAWELSKHVSESERLYIAGHYYGFVTGDVTKQVETLQESIQTYPAQVASYININVAYQTLGQFAQALPYAQKAVGLQPDDAIAAENLLQDQIALGQMAAAQQEMDREHKQGMDDATDVANIFLVGYFLQGRQQEVQKIATAMVGRPDEFLISSVLAATQGFSGQFQQESATVQQGVELAGRVKAPDVQASMLLSDAAGRGLAGMCDTNASTVQKALAFDKSKQTVELVALTAAICGDGKVGLPMIQSLARENPNDTIIQDVYLPLTKAWIAESEGKFREVADDAAPARSYDAIYPSSYLIGLAALQLHDANGAISAFRSAVQYPASSLVFGIGAPFYAESQLGLGRAYAMAGDKADAKQAYTAFFTTWKNADSDVPLLIAAKKEFAAL
jgi:serine/threonine protein kinase/tetratricopeptide (TPR) repeat protein